jgi:hypothetical protein
MTNAARQRARSDAPYQFVDGETGSRLHAVSFNSSFDIRASPAVAFGEGDA